MRIAFALLAVLTIACAAFGYWGLHTQAGRRAFDEMAGMLPLFSAWGSIGLAVITAIVGWLAWRGQ